VILSRTSCWLALIAGCAAATACGSAQSAHGVASTARSRTQTQSSPRQATPLRFPSPKGTATWIDQSASASRIEPVPDPAGGGGMALRFTADNGDVAPLTPTDNPRAQLVTPTNIVTAGQPFWESYEVFLPSDFPVAQTDGGWVALGSPFYGAPYEGSPSVGLEITGGRFRWTTDAHAQVHGQILWQSPVILGRWVRFTWYIVPARDGFAELSVGGRAVSVTYEGRTGYGAHIPVIDAGNARGPWSSQLSVYYRRDEFSSATIYFRRFAIGTTRAAAEAGT
jgi:hypothetical protein